MLEKPCRTKDPVLRRAAALFGEPGQGEHHVVASQVSEEQVSAQAGDIDVHVWQIKCSSAEQFGALWCPRWWPQASGFSLDMSATKKQSKLFSCTLQDPAGTIPSLRLKASDMHTIRTCT